MTERADLAARLESLRGVRVLCVGDLMLDRFVLGAVERVSPEAPIPVIRVEDETAMPGGAGNVVRNLAALGAGAGLVGLVGDDAAGREVAALLSALPGVEAHLVTAGDRPTTVKIRYLAGGQQMLRADRERAAPADARTAAALAGQATRALAGSKAVILSDYGKGVVTAEVAEPVIAAARNAGVPVVVDPKGRDYARYKGATVLTPNRRELAEATGLATGGDDDTAAAGCRLLADLGAGAVLVTRGRAGMTLVTRDGVEHLAAEAREVYDVSGAGDTVAATVAAALAAGVHVSAAARLANAAAGIVVGKAGTAVVHAGELFSALHRQDLMAAEDKVRAPAEALDRIALWRHRGLRVGFTNGVFDLLHPGHVSLLGQARAACDRLVVGLNSDASARRLKGEGRPVQGESARAAVLASLAAVDLVVIFSEDTPIGLIEAIRPDVLVKGADYRIDQVVGADVVRSYGGRVLLADVSPGHSTTATIARLAK